MESTTNKRLVIYTLLLTVVLTAIVLLVIPNKEREIDLNGHPLLGNKNAKVQVVAFESLDCSHCKAFMDGVFAPMRRDYIDTGKVKYSPILESASWTSISAQTAYCIMRQSQTSFFKFIDLAYLHQPQDGNYWSMNGLLSLAKQIPEIDVEAARNCIENGESIATIRNNLMQSKWIQKTFHRSGVPKVFINNRLVDPLTREEVYRLIELALHQGR